MFLCQFNRCQLLITLVFAPQVHIVTQRCNVRASCNCAATIRSGDTVIYIDRCRKKSFMARFCGHDKYRCVNLMKTSLFGHNRITPGTRIYSRINGKEISVSLLQFSTFSYDFTACQPSLALLCKSFVSFTLVIIYFW